MEPPPKTDTGLLHTTAAFLPTASLDPEDGACPSSQDMSCLVFQDFDPTNESQCSLLFFKGLFSGFDMGVLLAHLSMCIYCEQRPEGSIRSSKLDLQTVVSSHVAAEN